MACGELKIAEGSGVRESLAAVRLSADAPDLTLVRRGHHETRTHAASRSGTSGPVLCCLDSASQELLSSVAAQVMQT